MKILLRLDDVATKEKFNVCNKNKVLSKDMKTELDIRQEYFIAWMSAV